MTVSTVAVATTQGTPNLMLVASAACAVAAVAWTVSADGRTLTHDEDEHKEIYVYEKQ